MIPIPLVSRYSVLGPRLLIQDVGRVQSIPPYQRACPATAGGIGGCHI